MTLETLPKMHPNPELPCSCPCHTDHRYDPDDLLHFHGRAWPDCIETEDHIHGTMSWPIAEPLAAARGGVPA